MKPKLVICEKYHKCRNKMNECYPCEHGEEHEHTDDCLLCCEDYHNMKIPIDCLPIRAIKLKELKTKERRKPTANGTRR